MPRLPDRGRPQIRTQASAERGYDAEQVDRETPQNGNANARLGSLPARRGSPAQGFRRLPVEEERTTTQKMETMNAEERRQQT